jgi:adenylate cyclase
VTATDSPERRQIDWPFLVRRTRLCTGLVLFVYVATHLVNHAIGAISLEALELSRRAFVAVWRTPIATFVLYLSLIIHALLALWSIYNRRSLRMPVWEAAQLLLGLTIPPLLFEHILGTRVAEALYGLNDTYTYVLLVYWVFSPTLGLQQVVVLLLAWLHACIGLHFWLRLRPWYGRMVPYLYGAALLIPVLALIGFGVAGRNVLLLAQDQQWLRPTLAGIRFPPAASVAALNEVKESSRWLLAGLLALTLVARQVRGWAGTRRKVTIAYGSGQRVAIERGMTVLEASRSARIPHASVCGGRGRCSTCRVRVGAGAERLPPATPEEQKVLDRVGAPPKVRLACQIRPQQDLEVTPILPPTATPQEALRRPSYLAGSEKEIIVMFADLRGFTQLSEHRLPFDVVFLLNRYFADMGRAIEGAGGRVDKFIGDGIMALFGIESGPAQGAREAIEAARAMSEGLEHLNRALTTDLAEPLRMGIGLHAGVAIVGEMGFGRATSLTAIGDSVNTASRLESLTKEFKVQLIVSDDVERLSEVDLARFPRHEIDVRGRTERIGIRAIASAGDIRKPSASASQAPATASS